MRAALWAAAALVALIVLDRLALRAERRGWIFYRRRKPSPRSLGSALLEVQSHLEPRARAVVEASAEQLPEGDVGADPPDPAGDGLPDDRPPG